MRLKSLISGAVFALGASLVLWPLAGLAQPAAGGKSIRDPTEAAAWAKAMTDPEAAAQAAALEAFALRYPSSVVRVEALAQAMADYQVLNDTAKAEDIARRILQIVPGDVRALAVVVYLERTRAEDLQGAAQVQMAGRAAAEAGRGLKSLTGWAGPEGLPAAQVETIRAKLAGVFYGALGFERLVSADYPVARYYYLKAVQADVEDVRNDYELALVDLHATPLDQDGFWWAAKAYALAGAAHASASQAAIAPLAKQSYSNFHGGEDGWDELLAQAQSQNAPPQGFAIKRGATPAELAVQAVKDNDVSALTVPDWEFILALREASDANRVAADRVWAGIMAEQDGGKSKLKLPVKVLSSSRTAFEGAITPENQQAGHADLHVIFTAPVDTAPAPGSTVQVTGLITTYAARPFAFTMRQAEVSAQ